VGKRSLIDFAPLNELMFAATPCVAAMEFTTPAMMSPMMNTTIPPMTN